MKNPFRFSRLTRSSRSEQASVKWPWVGIVSEGYLSKAESVVWDPYRAEVTKKNNYNLLAETIFFPHGSHEYFKSAQDLLTNFLFKR